MGELCHCHLWGWLYTCEPLYSFVELWFLPKCLGGHRNFCALLIFINPKGLVIVLGLDVFSNFLVVSLEYSRMKKWKILISLFSFSTYFCPLSIKFLLWKLGYFNFWYYIRVNCACYHSPWQSCVSDVKNVSFLAGFTENRKNVLLLFSKHSKEESVWGKIQNWFILSFFAPVQKNEVKSVSVKAYVEVILSISSLFNFSFSCSIRLFEGNIWVYYWPCLVGFLLHGPLLNSF